MKIYLVRHGETDWNKAGRFQGSENIPLNQYGIELAEVTSEGMKEIPIDIIYTSPLIRARKTAEIMRRDRRIEIIEDDRLKEMSFGRFEGADIREARADKEHGLHDFISNPGIYRAKDGENFEDVIARCHSFIDEILLPREKNYDSVMVAAHGALIRCFLRCIEDRPLSEFWGGVPQGNCAVTIVELEDGQLRILEEGKLYYYKEHIGILG